MRGGFCYLPRPPAKNRETEAQSGCLLSAEDALDWLGVRMPGWGVLTPPCPPSQGDLKRYLRAQRPPEGLSPELPPRDLRTLQRMGLEIARGLAHLHSHNYVHRWQLGRRREGLWGGTT